MRVWVLLGLTVAAACQPVETTVLELQPVPSTLDVRRACVGREGVDTLVLDLMEVFVDEGADPGGAARAAGLCGACDVPGSGIHCVVRQRVCTCVDEPLDDAAAMNTALAGVRLDAPLEDALTCVRVVGLHREEPAGPGAEPRTCSELSFCPADASLAAGAGASFCAITDARGPDSPDLPVTPEILTCQRPESCDALERLCADPRLRDDSRFAELCDDYDVLCGEGGGPLRDLDDCLCLGDDCR